jgi:chorismate synthase
MRFLTAGESHGRALTVIVEGMPAGLAVDKPFLDRHLAARQVGFGRSRRMKIEADEVEILSGIRHGLTLGTPVSLVIRNRDWENWASQMSPESPGEDEAIPSPVQVPRPGHADLSGALKFGFTDIRNALERASARETAARVAAGSLARRLLEEFEVQIAGHVVQVGAVRLDSPPSSLSAEQIAELTQGSDLRCVDSSLAEKMRQEVQSAADAGDSVGGVFEVIADGLPPGLGSYTHWDRRLDGLLAQAVASIPGVKGVEFGLGFQQAALRGSEVHDAIFYNRQTSSFFRTSNNAGGLEGGISNGQPLVIRGIMKPIPTLTRPLQSVHLATKEPSPAHAERSDVCAVPSAAVVAEAMVAWVLAQAFLEKFGGDSLSDVRSSYEHYLRRIAAA